MIFRGGNSHGTYAETLFDPRWKTRRKQILERDQYKCVLCGSTESLHVHHRQYHFIERLQKFKDPWEYDGANLITLCEKCHTKGHTLYNIPTKYIK